MSGKKTKNTSIAKILGVLLGILLLVVGALGFCAVFLLAMSLWWLCLPGGLIVLGFFLVKDSVEDKKPTKRLKKSIKLAKRAEQKTDSEIEQSVEEKKPPKQLETTIKLANRSDQKTDVEQKIENEVDQKQERDFNHALNQFSLYAQGEISAKEIDVPEDSEIYQFLWNSQQAHFMMDVHLEIDRSKEPKEKQSKAKKMLQEKITPLLETVNDASFEKMMGQRNESKEAKVNVKDVDRAPENKAAFGKLFAGMSKNSSRIKRPIYQAQRFRDELGLLFESRRKFVFFGTSPDGTCNVYCIDVRDKEELLNLIIDHLAYSENDHLRCVTFVWLMEECYESIVISFVEKQIHKDLNDLVFAAFRKGMFVGKKYTKLEKLMTDLYASPSKEQEASLNKLSRLDSGAINSAISEKIKTLVSYSDDQKFRELVDLYLDTKWLDSQTLETLTSAMHRKNKQSRLIATFIVSAIHPRQLRKTPGNDGEVSNFYELVWDESKRAEADVLSIYADNEFFYYAYIHPNGKIVQNKVDKQALVKAFEEEAKLCAKAGQKEQLFYEEFIEKLKNQMLIREEKISVFQAIIPIIAEKEELAPGPYAYSRIISKIHATRSVELDDYEGLIKGKIHENRFQLCQTQPEYNLYEQTWITPYPGTTF